VGDVDVILDDEDAGLCAHGGVIEKFL
jgi:hypothetical protein